LEKVGIEMERERIKTDEYMRTNVPHIYAVGDCTTPMMLAHVAFKEAEVAVDHIMGRAHKMRYNAMPNVIYTHPEIATVGMTEQQAKEAGYEVEVGRYNFAANGRSLSENSKVGFAKCVIDKKSKEVLGVHCVGHYVSELISGPASVIGLEANIEEVLNRFVHPHPTLSEVTYEAYADSIGMAVHK
jgi:dihydrolipoamide dehydrogenase